MNITKEQMTTCRKCGSEHCYETITDGKGASWSCLLCGFTTSTSLLENTIEADTYLKQLPLLYQQLSHVDSDGMIWVPQYRKVESVGEVYANTVDTGVNWFWTAAKHVLVLPEEKELYRNIDGSYRTYKADAANAKHFHKEAFFGAIHYLGII